MRESNHNFPVQNRACVCISSQLYDRRALDNPISTLPLVTSLTHLAYLTSTSPRIRDILTSDGGLERLSAIVTNCLKAVQQARSDQQRGVKDGQSLTASQLAAKGGPFRPFASYSSRPAQPAASTSTLPLWNPAMQEIIQRPIQVVNDDAILEPMTDNLQATPASPTSSNLGPPIRIDAMSARSSMTGSAIYQRSLLVTYALALQSLVNVGVRGTEVVRTRVVEAGVLNVVAKVLAGYLDEREALQNQLKMIAAEKSRAVTSSRRQQHAMPSTSRAEEDFIMMLSSRPVQSRANRGETTAASSLPEGFLASGAPTAAQVAPILEQSPTIRQTPRNAAVSFPVPIPIPAARSMRPQASTAPPSPVASTSRILLPSSARAPSPASVRLAEHVQPSSLPRSFAPRLAADDSLVVPSLSEPSSRAPSRVGTPDVIFDNASITTMPAASPTQNDRQTAAANVEDVDQGTGSSEDGDAIEAEDVVMAAVSNAEQESIASASSTIKDVAPIADSQTPRSPARHLEDRSQDMDIDGSAQTADVIMSDATVTDNVLTASVLPVAIPMEDPQETLRPQDQMRDPDRPRAPRPAERGHRHLFVHTAMASRTPLDALYNGEVDTNLRFRDEDVLLCLQLLAYLSKYPHIRAVFHEPSSDYTCSAMQHAEVPPLAPFDKTANIFLLVERFTVRPTSSSSTSDRAIHRLSPEITYWAGTIMRNACRKDENRGGIRQCASMLCGAWETYPREFAKCRRCRKARYCSKDCQSKAWAGGHRFWCSARDTEQQNQAPGLAALRNLPSGEAALIQRYIEQYPYLATAPDALNELIRRLRYAQQRQARNTLQAVDRPNPVVPAQPQVEIAMALPAPTFNEAEGPEEEDDAATADQQDDGRVVIADLASEQQSDLLSVTEEPDAF